jgi:homoserine O-succinyltransferase
MRGVNTRFDAPHSRYNEIRTAELEDAGLVVLAESPEAGVHLIVSPDQCQIVYFQGHPEYNSNSLLKEYKREVFRYFAGERETEPRYPEHYFSDDAKDVAANYVEDARQRLADGQEIPAFPDDRLNLLVDNTWGDTGRAIVNNWLGLVYQLTSLDRKAQFGPGIDPEDPLRLRA